RAPAAGAARRRHGRRSRARAYVARKGLRPTSAAVSPGPVEARLRRAAHALLEDEDPPVCLRPVFLEPSLTLPGRALRIGASAPSTGSEGRASAGVGRH